MLPVGFALILVVTALIGLNRFAFAVISMGGWACHSRDQSEQLKAVGESKQFTFKLADGCFASPISLVQGATYEIKIDNIETHLPSADGRIRRRARNSNTGPFRSGACSVNVGSFPSRA